MRADFERFDVHVSVEDAQSCSQPGDMDENVKALARTERVSARLTRLDPADVRAELKEYGAWDDEDLADDTRNLERILWIACCNIAERARG